MIATMLATPYQSRILPRSYANTGILRKVIEEIKVTPIEMPTGIVDMFWSP